MPLLHLDKVSLAYGHRALLERATLEVEAGERVCLVGRNGEGKSSLLGVIDGRVTPDDGECRVRSGVRIASLEQQVDTDSDESVFDVVAGGLPAQGQLLKDYHHAVTALDSRPSAGELRVLERLQHELEAADAWQLEQRVETVLSRLGLDGTADMHSLSGGWRRRVMLAQALVCEPDLLLLDEPTNHLDIEAIRWLEEFMSGFTGALLFVSHDRAFVRRLATRVVELDRGRLSSWPGSYDEYLRRKAEQLAIEARHNAQFDKKLSGEEAWIRQGIKARRTRNEGRVRALKALREQRSRRRERVGKAKLRLQDAERSGKLVIEAEDVGFSYGDREVIRDFNTTILRGDRVGIIGPNGAGKSTLLRVLLGELRPGRGKVTRGTRLEIIYFDQQRAQLDADATVMDSVGDGSQQVTINGQSRHVAGYLQDFLFDPGRLQSPVRTLSGGERNRLLLARLFAQPANLLVLDEPTNDLDMETLELLEQLLIDYRGTLLLVSHDREFLDNVVTSTLVLEGDGRIGEYVGGYSDWLARREPDRGAAPAEETGGRPSPATERSTAVARPRKLSYKDQRELEALPARIEALEKEQAALESQLNLPGFYQQPREEIDRVLGRLAAVNGELDECFGRWAELEA